MIYPKIEDFSEKVDSRYTLVVLAAKRARQINSYYAQLGQGIRDYVPPQVPSLPDNAKALTIALEEIDMGKFGWERPVEVADKVK